MRTITLSLCVWILDLVVPQDVRSNPFSRYPSKFLVVGRSGGYAGHGPTEYRVLLV